MTTDNRQSVADSLRSMAERVEDLYQERAADWTSAEAYALGFAAGHLHRTASLIEAAKQ